jgi:hypothetical protein
VGFEDGDDQGGTLQAGAEGECAGSVEEVPDIH